jgi:hypothetical protein
MTKAFEMMKAGLDDAIGFTQGNAALGKLKVIGTTSTSPIEGWTMGEVAELLYRSSPTLDLEEEKDTDGTVEVRVQESTLTWEQAAITRSPEYLEALTTTERIFKSRIPAAEFVKIIGIEKISGEMGQFTDYYNGDWLVETRFGKFHWQQHGIHGDNVFIFFEGDHQEFAASQGGIGGVDKGLNLIANKCGDDLTLVVPQLDD